MGKLIAIILVTVSLTAFGQQKKDTNSHQLADTAYVISKHVKQILETLLRQNSLYYNAKQLSFDDILSLIQELNKGEIKLPKQEQKEQPKK